MGRNFSQILLTKGKNVQSGLSFPSKWLHNRIIDMLVYSQYTQTPHRSTDINKNVQKMSSQPSKILPTVIYKRAGKIKTVVGVLWIHPNYTSKNCLKDVLKATAVFINVPVLQDVEDGKNLYDHFSFDSQAPIWFQFESVKGGQELYSIRKADRVKDAAILAKYPE
jgi:hypothetical protein